MKNASVRKEISIKQGVAFDLKTSLTYFLCCTILCFCLFQTCVTKGLCKSKCATDSDRIDWFKDIPEVEWESFLPLCVISACNMPQSDRNNGLFHCLRQAGDGEVHHGKQTGRQARTVERGYFREASHKPRQQAMALQLPDIGHVWVMCLDYCCFVKHTRLKTLNTHQRAASSHSSPFYGRKNKVRWDVFICFWCMFLNYFKIVSVLWQCLCIS